MPVKWLRTGLKSLDEEVAYIAKENPEAATLVVKCIVDAALL